MLTRGVLLLHDNAPAHTARVALAAARECNFEILPTLLIRLAPSDFHLFPNLKGHLKGNHFSSNEEVTEAVEQWLSAQPESFYSVGISALYKRWEKCIHISGSYVEKYDPIYMNRFSA